MVWGTAAPNDLELEAENASAFPANPHYSRRPSQMRRNCRQRPLPAAQRPFLKHLKNDTVQPHVGQAFQPGWSLTGNGVGLEILTYAFANNAS